MVELLVALAVLAIIVVTTAQILSTASLLTTLNNKHMDANSQARSVFDRMADDFDRMVRRPDVDSIFWKAAGNDAMYFYTEGSSYFDTSTFAIVAGYGSNTAPEKNSISLVGYRVNNNPPTAYASGTNPSYYQLERLGKALAWDGGAYNPPANNTDSHQPNFVVFLTYPQPPTNASATDPVTYSTAFFNSTLAGAYSNGSGSLPSAVGTYPGGNSATGTLNDSADSAYHTLGSQVFRFEFSFQLKDGTASLIPVMTPSVNNGLPTTSNLTAQAPPTNTADSSANYAVNSRWYDAKNQIGYICIDATKGYAVWHEIGTQDISAISVTIAVIDRQGLVLAKANNLDLAKLAVAFPDPTNGPSATALASTWASAILPGGTVSTMSNPKFPQPIVSQIRIYQRFFYLNNI